MTSDELISLALSGKSESEMAERILVESVLGLVTAASAAVRLEPRQTASVLFNALLDYLGQCEPTNIDKVAEWMRGQLTIETIERRRQFYEKRAAASAGGTKQ